ncbi:hypothetical protein RhiirC2_747718 [Rhizophagus irregularis]|uniref:Uncharacterized protein n=1 Tax=Rhizophagus irregularis TaxID=588596 RepID=A0A2I1GGM9_9GLOM|nr:hypothetical protein RhiirC2_747718 [Rhizophagus irregularis]PKY45774.1 hypothetical protein RhiirA4_401647 [Rhizophagus irregularis]PKY61638.1 hypothetical protein RhiirA4_412965 [Rhizophagus irregularis]
MSPPKKEVPKSISYNKGSSSTQRSIFNTKAKNANDIKELTACTPKELREKLDKNNKLLENEDIISKLPDKGQKLRERNILINELLEKHKSTLSNPINELEDLVSKMSIDDNNKKSYAITPASLVNKKNGRYYSSSVKTNQISIEESIKLQKHQEKLRQKFQIHTLSEKFEQMTVDKKETIRTINHPIEELENYISEESYDSLNSDNDDDYL